MLERVIQFLKGGDYKTMTYPFKNLPLSYGYNGLEPYIDEKTMELHHDKHLQKYIDTLNETLAPYPQYHGKTLTQLLKEIYKLPAEIQILVKRNAGGVYNHFFWFEQLTPVESKPSEKLAGLLDAYFGSFEAFKNQFKEAALSAFGSGYAWLIQGAESDDLEIVTSRNQDCPVSEGMAPLLNIDVWEHAYYLKHYNDRGAYIDDFFKVADWGMAEKRVRV